MNVGFTGTRRGLVKAQVEELADLLITFKRLTEPCFFHHGDCIGADAQAHKVAWEGGYSIVIHPPQNRTLRAFCQNAYVTKEPLPYMVRNENIVRAANVLIAGVGEYEEQQQSGTWATVRRARKKGIPIYIIWPSGLLKVENENG